MSNGLFAVHELALTFLAHGEAEVGDVHIEGIGWSGVLALVLFFMVLGLAAYFAVDALRQRAVDTESA